MHDCCVPYAVIGCKLKQNANEVCNSCASLAGLVLCFIAFYFTCDRSFRVTSLAVVIEKEVGLLLSVLG